MGPKVVGVPTLGILGLPGLVNIPSFHPGTPTRPSTPEVLQAKERAPTPSPFAVYTFGSAVESIKELWGVSPRL
jgi:hypothetical protein